MTSGPGLRHCAQLKTGFTSTHFHLSLPIAMAHIIFDREPRRLFTWVKLARGQSRQLDRNYAGQLPVFIWNRPSTVEVRGDLLCRCRALEDPWWGNLHFEWRVTAIRSALLIIPSTPPAEMPVPLPTPSPRPLLRFIPLRTCKN